MNGRSIVRLPYVLALVMGLALSAVAEANAQTPTKTQEVARCIDNAASAFADCVDGTWVSVLCAARYAADALLCLPSVVL